jgi:hypothetical protein
MFICAFATCKVEYPSLNILKKHLNEVHKRQFWYILAVIVVTYV